jgi:hypothetical protein
MPLSLFLTGTFTTWQRDLSRWYVWGRLIDLEQTLLERARGAFLARWFGGGLPTSQGEPLVFLSNIEELTARVRQLRRGSPSQEADRNLTEPLAGITGTLVGALLSPTSSFILMPVIAEQMPKWTTQLAAALNTITLGALGPLVAALGVPLVGLGAPYLALTRPAEAVAGFGILGALAGLFLALRRFFEQLVGPRSEVRNPLLRQVLNVLDSWATLVPFLFALVAFAITWLGPKLAPLARQLDLLIKLAEDVFSVIGLVVTDLFERLQGLFVGKNSPWAVVGRIAGTFRQWLGLMGRQFVELLGAGAKVFEPLAVLPAAGEKGPPRKVLPFVRDLEAAFDMVGPLFKQLTSENWLVLRGKEIGERLTHIVAIFGNLEKHPVKHKEPGWLKARQTRKFKEAVPPWPTDLAWPEAPIIRDFPSAEFIFGEAKRITERDWVQPSLVEAFQKPGGGYAFILDRDAEKALARIKRSPVDLFVAERKSLLARPELGGKTLEQYLHDAREAEAKLRSELFVVLDSLLPPAVAEHVPNLQGLFWELDTKLYGKKEAEFPVRDLPGGDLLNVKVGPVRIRTPGRKAAIVRDWGKDLKTALQNQVYRTEPAAT